MDIDLILESLNSISRKLKSVYIKKVMGDIDSGKIPKEKYLSLRTSKTEMDLRKEKSYIHRKLTFEYKEIVSQYLKDYNRYSLEPRHNQRILEICRKALYVTPFQIEIDIDKFIEVYKDFISADESITKKMHQDAADALNSFFNGLPITQKELSNYFSIEGGRVEIQLNSVNLKSYSRLGKRTVTINGKDIKKK